MDARRDTVAHREPIKHLSRKSPKNYTRSPDKTQVLTVPRSNITRGLHHTTGWACFDNAYLFGAKERIPRNLPLPGSQESLVICYK